MNYYFSYRKWNNEIITLRCISISILIAQNTPSLPHILFPYNQSIPLQLQRGFASSFCFVLITFIQDFSAGHCPYLDQCVFSHMNRQIQFHHRTMIIMYVPRTLFSVYCLAWAGYYSYNYSTCLDQNLFSRMVRSVPTTNYSPYLIQCVFSKMTKKLQRSADQLLKLTRAIRASIMGYLLLQPNVLRSICVFSNMENRNVSTLQ